MIVNLYGIPTNTLLRWLLTREFEGGVGTWVDLGCGSGAFTSTIGVVPKKGIGVDAVSPKELHFPPTFSFEKGEVKEWLRKNRGKNFDVVSLFGLVEHLKKNDSLELIHEAEAVGDVVLILTPHGFLRQDAETNVELAGNLWQWHRSGFTAREFSGMGFLVFAFKNYHLRVGFEPQSYDELVVFRRKGYAEGEYRAIARMVRWRALCYNLNPLHLFRTVRQFVRHHRPYPKSVDPRKFY